jgi:hypothetical protein
MKSLFKWALYCFIGALLLALSSILLGTWLSYTSHLSLFNTIAAGILVFILASFCISLVGIVRERIKRYRYLILLAVNALFMVWVILG